MELGRLGIWYAPDKLGSAGAISEFVKTVEGLGYDTLWYPESRGYESFSVAGYMLGHTKKLKLGSSIASIYARDAFTARRGGGILRAGRRHRSRAICPSPLRAPARQGMS